MNLIERYIGIQVIQAILLIALGLLGIDVFFYLINELRFVGKGDYTLLSAFTFVALTIPRKVYIMFPWSALIGTLMALGQLAKHSELVAMRSAGISIRKISVAVLQAALLLTIMIALLGEIVAPYSERIAQQTKTLALSQGQAIQTQFGVWIRHENEFIHIGQVTSAKKLQNITRYVLNEGQEIKEVSFAKTANKLNNDSWLLTDIEGTVFHPDKTEKLALKERHLKDLLDSEILATSGIKHLERLSMRSLWQAIKSRSDNELNTQDYQLAFWTKLIWPFAILVMVFLAIPFAFGPLRSSSMGLKLIVGILVGFGFHTLNQIFAPLTIVVNFPPFLAALTPTVVFFAGGYWMIQRVR